MQCWVKPARQPANLTAAEWVGTLAICCDYHKVYHHTMHLQCARPLGAAQEPLTLRATDTCTGYEQRAENAHHGVTQMRVGSAMSVWSRHSSKLAGRPAMSTEPVGRLTGGGLGLRPEHVTHKTLSRQHLGGCCQSESSACSATPRHACRWLHSFVAIFLGCLTTRCLCKFTYLGSVEAGLAAWQLAKVKMVTELLVQQLYAAL